MHDDVRKAIEEFVKKAELKKALKLLESVPEFRQLAISLVSRLSYSERLRAEGRISEDNFDVKQNSLTHDLLFLIGNEDEHPSRKLPSAIPPRPLNYIDREKLVEIKDALLTSDERYFGVFGQPGVGKTVLIAELARNKEVQVAFDGGVYWVGFNIGDAESLKEPGPIPYQKKLYRQLVNSEAGELNVQTWHEGLTKLQTIAANKFDNNRCLIIVDHPFGVDNLLDAIEVHENAVFLIITNDRSLLYAKGLKDSSIFEVEVDEDDALSMLSEWLDIPKDKLPQEAQDISVTLGHLPLAIAMVGANLQGRKHDLAVAFSDINEIIKEGKLETAYPVDSSPWRKLGNLFDWVLKRLEDEEKESFYDLAILPQGWQLNTQLLLVIWKNKKPYWARQLAQKLVDKGLVQKSGDGKFVLHNLMRLHLRNSKRDFLPVFEHVRQSYFSEYPPAVLAALWRDIALLKIVSLKYNLTEEHESGLTALHAAAIEGDNDTIDVLIELGVDIELRSSLGHTPLIDAVFVGQIASINYLLDKGADINVREASGKSALEVAVILNQPEAFDVLVERGADINAANDSVGNLFLGALANDDPVFASKVLSKMDSAAISGEVGISMLEFAVDDEKPAFVKLLLDAGVRIISSSKQGNFSPLHAAVNIGNIAILQMLIQRVADVDIPAQDNFTPLHSAAVQRNIEVVKLLLDAGANPNALFQNTATALDLVKAYYKNESDSEQAAKYKQLIDLLQEYETKNRS
jgi:ankyrin repeat protein